MQCVHVSINIIVLPFDKYNIKKFHLYLSFLNQKKMKFDKNKNIYGYKGYNSDNIMLIILIHYYYLFFLKHTWVYACIESYSCDLVLANR